jgi:DNA (cytosine-5)-methyltransferase 1
MQPAIAVPSAYGEDPSDGEAKLAHGLHENQRAELRMYEVAPEMTTGGGKPGQGYPAVAVRTAQTGANGHGVADDVAHTLDSSASQAVGIIPTSLVRRLTPLECERLQGFPDGWTDIKVRKGKRVKVRSKGGRITTRFVPTGERVKAKDSARYRALGNAVAVVCTAWLGMRIRLVHEGYDPNEVMPAWSEVLEYARAA